MERNNNNLPPAVASELQILENKDTQKKIEQVLRYCLQCINHLERIHLPQDQVKDAGILDISNEVRLAEIYLENIKFINTLLQYLTSEFPPPSGTSEEENWDEDAWDLEFDLIDAEQPTEAPETPVVLANAKDVETEIADTAFAFGHMLQQKLYSFSERLEFAITNEDPWVLLTELDDYKHKVLKGLQALYFGLLSAFSQTPRSQLLPGYESAVTGATQLRKDIAQLAFHVDRFNEAISQKTGQECLPYVVALFDRLAGFARKASYRTLRAQDKREFINFRKALHDIRHHKDGINTSKLRLSVEGFSKFLESLHAINNREVLILHDKQIIKDALEAKIPHLVQQVQKDPLQAKTQFRTLLDNFENMFGRDLEIDTILRRYDEFNNESLDDVTMLGSLQELHRLARSILLTL